MYTNGVQSPVEGSPRSQTSLQNTRDTAAATAARDTAHTEPRANTVKTAPADIQHVALVGKSPPFEKIVRNTHVSSKQAVNPAASTDISSSELTVSGREGHLPPADNSTQKQSRLDISLPAVDMISASSAAVNSITDFSEYTDNNNHNNNNRYHNMYVNDVDTQLRQSVPKSADRSDSRTQSLPMSCHSAKRPPSIASFEEDPSKYDISVEIVEMKKVVEV